MDATPTGWSITAALTALIVCAAAQAEICTVRVPDGSGAFAMGHGVYVGQGIVLTAAHVIRGATEKPTIGFHGDRYQVQATEIAKDGRGQDLAGMVIVPPRGIRASKLCGKWPDGLVRTFRASGATERRWRGDGGPLFSFRGGSLFGDSGGPIWCDQGVVSVVSTSDHKSITHGPPPEALVSFLRRWKPEQAQIICGPYGCPPQGPQVGQAPVLVDPSDRDGDGLPDEPPAAPDVPAESPPMARPEAQQPSVEQIAAAVVDRIVTDEKVQQLLSGPKGEPGPTGPVGPKGDQGPAGPPGQAAPEVDVLVGFQQQLSATAERLQRMERRVDELAAGQFDVEIARRDGTIERSKVTAHGGLLRLEFPRKE